MFALPTPQSLSRTRLLRRCSDDVVAIVRAFAFIAVSSHCAAPEPTCVIEIITGSDLDALSRAPAPTTLVLEMLTPDGGLTQASETSANSGMFEVGLHPPGTIARFRFSALDQQRQTLLSGLTLRHALREQGRVRLFVSRKGEFARFPSNANANASGDAATSGFTAPCELVFDRYLVAGDSVTPQVYDFLAFAEAPAGFRLPFAAQNLLATGPYLFAVGGTDALGLVSVEPETARLEKRVAPSPVSEVAGVGATHTTSGFSYLIGALRESDTPTSTIWRFSKDGRTIDLQALSQPRAHAVAAAFGSQSVFVTSEGLAPEVVGGEASRALPFAIVNERPIAAAAQADGRHVVVVYNTGTVLRYDALCRLACSAERWPSRAPAVRGSAAAVNSGVLFVGPDDSSLLTTASAEPVAPKLRRAHPKLFQLPTIGVGLIGLSGNRAALEAFISR